MEILVRGKNVDVEPLVRTLAEEKVAKLPRFARDIDRVEVEFGKIRNPRVADSETCEITVHLKRHVLKARAAAPEQGAALDAALDKAAHQVTRLHDKRVQRSHRQPPLAAKMPADARTAPVESPNGDTPADVDGEEARIVRKKQLRAEPMSVDDASLQMDLLGHDFFLFTNAENGRAAVLYRRHDGHLGLIESVA